MSAVILPLRRKEKASQAWTNQEFAELYRVYEILGRAGLPVGLDSGVSDEGDPWCAFYREDNCDVIAHFAKFNGQFIAANLATGDVLHGHDLRDLIAVLTRYQPLLEENTGSRGNIRLHPAVILVAFVTMAFLLATDGSKAQAAEASHSGGDGSPPPGHTATEAGAKAAQDKRDTGHAPAAGRAFPADQAEAEQKAGVANAAIFQFSSGQNALLNSVMMAATLFVENGNLAQEADAAALGHALFTHKDAAADDVSGTVQPGALNSEGHHFIQTFGLDALDVVPVTDAQLNKALGASITLGKGSGLTDFTLVPVSTALTQQGGDDGRHAAIFNHTGLTDGEPWNHLLKDVLAAHGLAEAKATTFSITSVDVGVQSAVLDAFHGLGKVATASPSLAKADASSVQGASGKPVDMNSDAGASSTGGSTVAAYGTSSDASATSSDASTTPSNANNGSHSDGSGGGSIDIVLNVAPSTVMSLLPTALKAQFNISDHNLSLLPLTMEDPASDGHTSGKTSSTAGGTFGKSDSSSGTGTLVAMASGDAGKGTGSGTATATGTDKTSSMAGATESGHDAASASVTSDPAAKDTTEHTSSDTAAANTTNTASTTNTTNTANTTNTSNTSDTAATDAAATTNTSNTAATTNTHNTVNNTDNHTTDTAATNTTSGSTGSTSTTDSSNSASSSGAAATSSSGTGQAGNATAANAPTFIEAGQYNPYINLGPGHDIIIFEGGDVEIHNFKLGIDEILVDKTVVSTNSMKAYWDIQNNFIVDFSNNNTIKLVGLQIGDQLHSSGT